MLTWLVSLRLIIILFIALWYSHTRKTSDLPDDNACLDDNLVRLLLACETMENAITVCTDKTSTLTQNKMTTNKGIEISRIEVRKGASAYIFRVAGFPRKSGFQGTLNGISALILTDSGSEINLITQKRALQHRLSIDKSKKYTRKVRLANGGFLKIIGRATAEWGFEDSSGFIHHITFDVVAQCTNDIIVGHNFLQETCSFEERNKHRFIEIPRCMTGNQLFINSIGVSHHRLPILARASEHRRIQVDAIPDTGAEGNIISAAYVRKHRLRVYKTNKIFIFPDGTMQDSLGRVKLDVSFGNNPMQPVTTYFEVMRQCVHGAILGHDFVFDNNVYADNAPCLVETTGDFEFNLVDIAEKPEPNGMISEALCGNFDWADVIVDQQELNRLKEASQIAHDMVVASRTRGRANIPNSTPSTTPALSLPVQPHRQPRRWSRDLNRLRQICQKSG
ncbi:hypothetical protein BDD12DRAFT_829956 [Trichophaea hybrida]|nr:hypothetical protein BDD12DRAFT_829956 [Trichophaea hybrida]